MVRDDDTTARVARAGVARYRKVPVQTWDDPAFRALSAIPPCGQGLVLYLKTGPHTGPIPGLARAGRAGLSEALGWELEDFDKAFAEASAQGLAKADFKARVVWLPGEIQHNRPESPNVVKSWASEAQLIPECPLKAEALLAIRASIHALGEAFGKAWDEAFVKASDKPCMKPSAKAMPNQDRDKDKDTNKGPGKRGAAMASTADPVRPDDVSEKVWSDWKALRKAKRAPITETVLDGARAEAAKAGMPLEAFLRIWCMRGSQGLQADWLKSHERQAQRHVSAEQRDYTGATDGIPS